jgi:inward rectifier potassium channel
VARNSSNPLDAPAQAIRERDPFRFRADLYHRIMAAPWWSLTLLVAAAYLVVNVVFAWLYYLGGDCISGVDETDFASTFFFSVQTISTIGYGAMSPTTTYANVVVTIEALAGLLGFAMASGLMFAKFSRPTAYVLFSERAVIRPRDGVPTLCWRMANGRGDEVVEAKLHVTILMNTTTAEGETMRRFFPLKLVRDRSPFFLLTWTAMHPIDEDSPLHGLTTEDLESDSSLIVVTMTGIDSLTGQTIYARHGYTADTIDFDHKLVDVLGRRDDGRLTIDFMKFHSTEPL